MATRLRIRIETHSPEDADIFMDEFREELRHARNWQVTDRRKTKRPHIRCGAPRSDVRRDVRRILGGRGRTNVLDFECKARKSEHTAIVAGRFINFLLRKVGERIQRIVIEVP
jgi:hypothetical protein